MIKIALNASAPLFAVVTGKLYGIGSDKLGMALLVIMALAVIANQLWTLADRWRKSVRSPEADTSGITSACGRYRREIGRTLDHLRDEDARQDTLSKEHFDTIEGAIRDLRREMHESNKGITDGMTGMLQAISRMEGKVNS